MGNGVGMADGIKLCTSAKVSAGVALGSAGGGAAGRGATGVQPLNIMTVINSKGTRGNFHIVICPFNTVKLQYY
jgi:hypothetical protein